jgi:uncharacterized protein
MRFSLVPREEQYFDLIDQAGRYVVEAAEVLHELVNDYTLLEEKTGRMSGIEHACDEICHATLDRLDKTFITPMDREDIHTLILKVDDVVDMTDVAVNRMQLYGIAKPRPPVMRFTEIIRQQGREVHKALVSLRHRAKHKTIGVHLIEINRFENLADDLFREVIADLFRNEKDAIELVRWKAIYESLETVTDCNEDVSNVIQGITVKMA